MVCGAHMHCIAFCAVHGALAFSAHPSTHSPSRGRTCAPLCRRPRRLGGGKGGESRLIARPPKGIKRQFVSRILERAIAEK